MTFSFIPNVPTYPPEPFPSSESPAPPDAELVKSAMYEARREIFRARRAAMGNAWFGGLHAFGSQSQVLIEPGVAQLVLPHSTWSATPSGAKLITPEPATSGVDGAIRIEKRDGATLTAGTELPSTGERMVILRYNESAADRAEYAVLAPPWSGVDMSSAIPIAHVITDGGEIQRARDLKPTPYYRPRLAGYAKAADDEVEIIAPNDMQDPYLIENCHLGAFWVPPGYGVHVSWGLRLQPLNPTKNPGRQFFFAHVSNVVGGLAVATPFPELSAPLFDYDPLGPSWAHWSELLVMSPDTYIVDINGLYLRRLSSRGDPAIQSVSLRAEVVPIRLSDVSASAVPEFET